MTEENKEEVLEQEESPVNSLELSDDDFAQLAIPSEPEETKEEEKEFEASSEEQKEEIEKEEEIKATSDDSKEINIEEEKEEEVDPANKSILDAFKAAQDQEKKDASSEKENKEDKGDKIDADGEKEEKSESTINVDYKAEYKKLLTPFRANGKDMQINNVEDAITLMKMGANYNKKMAGLKPNLKLMKMLSNNDLLDEEKLTYLIDLQNKNPEAIAKFIKESGIDPLEIDTEGNTEYKPGTYTVDDSDVDLDTVLEDIQDTQSFQETIDIISNKWDDSSKKEVLANPFMIKIINEHVASGTYAQVMKIVEQERALSRLTELSDLDAYKHVGDVLAAQGAFKKPAAPAADTKLPTKAKSKDPKLNNRRRAASSPKGTSGATKANFDPLSMSDDEFEKVAASIGI